MARTSTLAPPEDFVVVENVSQLDSVENVWKELSRKLNNQSILVDYDYFNGMFSVFEETPSHELAQSSPYVAFLCQGRQPIAGLVAHQYIHQPDVKLGYFSLPMPKLQCLEVDIGGLMAQDRDSAQKLLAHIRSLLSRRSIDMLIIKHISKTSPFWPLLSEENFLGTTPIVKSFNEFMTQIADPSTGERIEYEKRAKSRKRSRAAERKLYQRFDDKIEVKCFSHPNTVEQFLAQADMIAKKSYQHSADIGLQASEAWQNELSFLAEQDSFRGYVLYGQDVPIAYNAGVICNGQFMGYAMSFDPEFYPLSPGVFLLKDIMSKLFEEGINTLHFGYGDSAYKKRFSSQSVEGIKLKFYLNSPAAKFVRVMDGIASAIQANAKSYLERLGLLSLLKKTWRSWLKSDRSSVG